ncbi:MAG: glycosyltransferase family 9 protein [Candidatus Dormibacter sp.]
MTESRSTTAIMLGGNAREALMAQAVIRAVRGAVIFAGPEAIGTLIGLPAVGRAFTLDASPARLGWAFRRLRTGSISRVILTTPVSAPAAALSYFAGVPRRMMLEGRYDWIATDRVRRIRGLHPVDANERLARVAAGADPSSTGLIVSPSLQPSAAVRQRVLDRFSGLMDRGADYLVIFPGRGSWSRPRSRPLWPAERFAVVANLSGARRVVVAGGPEDEPIVRETRSGIGKPTITVSLADLTIQEVAVMAAGSLAVIGHDGDALHVAAASGANVFGLLGDGDTAPRGPRVTALPVADFGRLPARTVAEHLAHHLRVTTYA